MDGLPRRRWLQFGIGTLLFVMFCVGGFFAGYRRGFEAGEDEKSRTRIYAVAYDVKDIMGALPRAGTAGVTLIKYIEASIVPRSWDTNGGPGSLAIYQSNKTLVVSNMREVHEQVADALAQIRLLQQQGKAKEAEAILVSADR